MCGYIEGIREGVGGRRQMGGVGGRGLLGWVGPMYCERSRRGCGVEGRGFSFFMFLFVWVGIVC